MRPPPLLAPAALRLSVFSHARVCAALDGAGIVRNERREADVGGRSAELATEQAHGVEADARRRSLEDDALVLGQPDPLPSKGELSRAATRPGVELLVGKGSLSSVLSAARSGGLDPVVSNDAAATRALRQQSERNVVPTNDDRVTVP